LNKFLLRTLPLLLIMPAAVWAAPDNNATDMVEDTQEAKTVMRKNKGTWLPVPIPVSNPTIGTGLQAALLYLHPRDSEDSTIPAATSGIIGMYTNTESWFAGGFHDTNWKEDLYRFRVITGTGEFNLDYFGSSEGSFFKNNPVPYKIKGDVFITQLLRQIPGTKDLYLGLRYTYIKSTIEFDLAKIFPGYPNLPVLDANLTNSGLGIMFTFDSRDNSYYPTSGSIAEIVWMRDQEELGSDFDFDKVTSYYNYYIQITDKDTLALRLDLDAADGDTPFYLLPTLKMRGFANGVYRDNTSMSGHIEWRRKFLPRWGFIAFYEAGSVADSVKELIEANDVTSYGGGLRWQVTEDKKLHLGVDVGFSGSDKAVYVQVGEKY